VNPRIKKHYDRIVQNDPGSIEIAPRQLAKSLDKLHAYDRGLFFSTLGRIATHQLLSVLLECSGETFATALQRIPLIRLEEALKDQESDNVADVINRVRLIRPELADKLFEALAHNDRQTVTRLSKFDEKVAGAYMQTELLKATPHDTLSQVKQGIVNFRVAEPGTAIGKLFVVDDAGLLLGSLHFSDLILFDNEDSIGHIMETVKPKPPITIRTHSPVEEVVRLFSAYDLSTVAVVNKRGVLKGRITHDDVYDLMQDLYTEEAYSMAGVDDAAEEQNSFRAGRARLFWLGINLGTILIASFIVGIFESAIHAYVALAVLLPVVAALGGNAGMQSLTVTIRRLALGEIDYGSIKMVLLRELKIVAINGLVIAALISAIAYIWFKNPLLSAIIALAMFLNLLLAGTLGGLIPLLLKRFGIDPAVASTVVLTTLTDAFGFFIFLGLAELLLV